MDCQGEAVQRLINSYRQRQLDDLLEFVPCDLFKLIQGRTLWMLGDSQIARWYRHVRCFLAPLAEKMGDGQAPRRDETITSDPQLLEKMEELLLKGYTGDQWGNQWHDMVAPICTHFVGGTRVCHGKVHLGQQLLGSYLPNLKLLNVSRHDVLVLNVGLWHHLAGGDEYRQLVQRLAAYYHANHTHLPARTLWRETSLQHFKLPTGEFPNPDEVEAKLGKNRTTCVPLQGALLRQDGSLWGSNAGVVGGGWRNLISTPLLRQAGMPVLGVWNESLPMHDLHEPGECTHFCSPGGYHVWTWQLWRMLREMPEGGGHGTTDDGQGRNGRRR